MRAAPEAVAHPTASGFQRCQHAAGLLSHMQAFYYIRSLARKYDTTPRLTPYAGLLRATRSTTYSINLLKFFIELNSGLTIVRNHLLLSQVENIVAIINIWRYL